MGNDGTDLKQHLATWLEKNLRDTPCSCTETQIDWGHDNFCWKKYLENGLTMLVSELTGKGRQT